MSSQDAFVCTIASDAARARKMQEQLAEVMQYESIALGSAGELRHHADSDGLVATVVDRDLKPMDLEELLKLADTCRFVTFGVSESESDALKQFESKAFYQLRHPAESVDLDRLANYLASNARGTTPAISNRSAHLYRGLVGTSPAVRDLRDMIQKIAASQSTVLISGETGTGKEIVARNIHYYSQQSSGPFVPVNCSAIPPDLLESELFGHKKGSFTGALSDRIGRFEMAAGGTLFLDEIGDMTPELQAKLLRVLEERIIQRVGCNKSISMTARVVAATHRNLVDRITDGAFREDLYYRLNVVPIDVPPLRDRKDDIPELTVELSRRLQRDQNVSVEISAAALDQLKIHDWPGNVRELANLVERLAVICPNGTAEIDDLPDQYKFATCEASDTSTPKYEILSHTLTAEDWPENGVDLRGILRSTEMQLIKCALDQSGGTMTQAAQLLHVGRTTLAEKVKRFGLGDCLNTSKPMQ